MTTSEVLHVVGRQVHLCSKDAVDLGPVRRVYVDLGTGRPTFCTVDFYHRSATHQDRQNLVCVHQGTTSRAGPRGPELVVPYSYDQIRRAPSVTGDEPLTHSQEDLLFAYYDVQGDRLIGRPGVQVLADLFDRADVDVVDRGSWT